ncbi:MAG: alpha/beta fold hydrolase [Saprospiraceae bacterium]
MKLKLLLLHGALGNKDQFASLKEKLISQFDIYDFNFSGHGSNTNDVEFSIELFMEDTLFFLDAYNLDNVNIFGYSMGGYVALKLAKEHPEFVNKIMTLGTKFHWNKESAEKEVKMLNPEIIEEKIPKFAEDLRQNHFPNDWKSIMRKTAAMMTSLGNGTAMKPSDFAAIAQPVLICVGAEDKMVTIGESQAIADLLQDADLMVIPGFKHPIELNDVEILSTLIQNYFKGR